MATVYCQLPAIDIALRLLYISYLHLLTPKTALKELAMKKMFALFLVGIFFFSIPIYCQTVDEIVQNAQDALKHRDYEQAFKLLEEAGGAVKSGTEAIYKYEILLRIANLQAASENFWQILETENLGSEFINERVSNIKKYLGEFRALAEIEGTSGNPLSLKSFPYERAADQKLLKA
ncbi:MAG TPA: hypothetical protein VK255_03425, partial [Patescibacteria group bacterium]|nr:hypothetical protein [Patescibacteria group bacterium]